jgi:hypothetical protein
MKYQRCFSICSLILFVFTAVVIVMPSHASITDIRVSNHQKNAVTISWLADSPTDGTVNYGTTCDNLDNSASDTTQRASCILYVDISGLQAGALYYYEVVSGGETDDNNGQCYTFQTTSDTGNPPAPYNVYGFVWQDPTMTTAAVGAIKYVRVIHGGTTSHWLSGITAANGAFFVDLANAKDPNTQTWIGYSTGDVIETFAEAIWGTDTGSYTVSGTAPQLLKPDEALPVVLALLTATPDEGGVSIKWRTESEINNLGFDVYRSESLEGRFVKVNPAYIKGAGTDATPHDYNFIDESAVVGKTYYYYLETISFSGERDRSHIIKVVIDVSGKMKVTGLMQPITFALLQNFPNPFNPETWIPFHLAKDADVTIRIFDIRGQEVRTIHLGQMPAGQYATKGKAVLWDGRDSYGQEVSSGIYFYSLTAGKFHATKKLTIIK